jgi:flagella basal body P-ring formation protein FlgA
MQDGIFHNESSFLKDKINEAIQKDNAELVKVFMETYKELLSLKSTFDKETNKDWLEHQTKVIESDNTFHSNRIKAVETTQQNLDTQQANVFNNMNDNYHRGDLSR